MGAMYSPSYPGSNAEYWGDYGDYSTCGGKQIGPDNIVTISAGSGVTVSAAIRHSNAKGNTLVVELVVPEEVTARFESNEIHFSIPPEGEKWTSKVDVFSAVFEGDSLSPEPDVDFLKPINKEDDRILTRARVFLSIYHYYDDTIIVQLPNILINGMQTKFEPITFHLKSYFGITPFENC
jgi:hypothetical protein